MAHPLPRDGRCPAHPELSHHLAGTATRRYQALNPPQAHLLLAQTHIPMEVVAAARAHLLAAQTHILMEVAAPPRAHPLAAQPHLMEVAVPVARDLQAVHP
jgi:hypothetical protein